MRDPSSFLSIAFSALVLLVVAFAVRAIIGQRENGEKSTPFWPAWLILAWLGFSGVIAASGLLSHFERFPPPVVPLILTGVATSLFLSSTGAGTRWISNWSLASIIGFQSFRLPLELLMHQAAREGVMPVQMSFAGLNYDILTGLLAVPLALGVMQGKLGKGWVAAWNLMGLALLLNVVCVAILSVPGPYRQFLNEPANVWIGYFPFVWLPTVLVPLAAAGHILVARKLFLGELE